MGDESNITALWRGVAGRIPPYFQSLAVTHNAGIAIGTLCQRGNHRRVIAFEEDSSRANALRERFDSVVTGISNIGEPVDAAVLAPESDPEWDGLAETMAAMSGLLTPNGCFLLIVPTERDPADMICSQNLQVVDRWEITVSSEGASASPHVLVLHREDYDRFAHAQSLADAGHSDWAANLLALAEGNGLEEEMRRLLAMQRYLLAGHDNDPHEIRLQRFFLAQSLFARITAQNPHCEEAFVVQAEFWNRLGNTNMARRLLRTLEYAQSGDKSETPYEPLVNIVEPARPPYEPAYRPRLLVILEPGLDYGADVLVDGLAEVLGDENVVDFPWKGSLHGEPAIGNEQYPCLFDRPGSPMRHQDLVQQLSAGQFDAIVYCAHTNSPDAEQLRALIAAKQSTPVYIVDQCDSPQDNRKSMAAHLGVPSDTPYFKREMLSCAHYGAHAYPLPFAYPSARLPALEHERNTSLFWAGHRQFGLRRLYLDHIESRFNLSFDQELSQRAYADAIAHARIGLNFFGLGFDTVRYWELPAHGCMLLSERLPIRIPHNFVHGESAVFFDDLEELERHVVYYLERPDEAAHIARAGRAHFEQHHTSEARAKQLLARMHRLELDSATD